MLQLEQYEQELAQTEAQMPEAGSEREQTSQSFPLLHRPKEQIAQEWEQ